METEIGVCKECFHDVEINCLNKIPGHSVWECPVCGYPNSMDDFWQVFKKEEADDARET